MRQPKPFTRKQSVYTSMVAQLINCGHDVANAIQGAKQIAREMKKI